MERKRGRLTALLTAVAVVGLLVFGLTVWQRDRGSERNLASVLRQLKAQPALEYRERNPQGFSEFAHSPTGIVLVLVPGGTFTMGGHGDQRERPLHEVTLSPFLIATCEVSQKQWRKVMSTNPSRFTGEELPVDSVSWVATQEFCKKTGLSLPSESQWEYACRAGTDGPYGGTENLDNMGWYKANSGGSSHPVGQKQPNGFGLYDMHGNLMEWCVDTFDAGFYERPESRKNNPANKSGSSPLGSSPMRSCRGGCWENRPARCRSAYRSSESKSSTHYSNGFRPVFNLPEVPETGS